MKKIIILLFACLSLPAYAELTAGQKAQLQADILADPAFNSLPHNSDSAFDIAKAYNLLATPDFNVWKTDVRVADIFDNITWDKYTPAELPTDSTASLYSSRLLAVQTKQMNLQNMTVGRDTLDTSRNNIRKGLRDAVIQLPTGIGGANTTAGGANGVDVLTVCVRKATRAEKLFNGGESTTGTVTASLLTFEGSISAADVIAAMGW